MRKYINKFKMIPWLQGMGFGDAQRRRFGGESLETGPELNLGRAISTSLLTHEIDSC